MENLPLLDDKYALSADQIHLFQKNGSILLREVLHQNEIAVYRQAILNAVQRLNQETRPLAERDTYGKAFLQIMNIWEVDEAIKKLVFSSRLAKIAAQLLGVEKVRLYHDQALFKEPGGGITPWHQDQYYWPLDTDKTVTIWMPLVDTSVDMGMLTFAQQSQNEGFLGNLAISDNSEAVLTKVVQDKGYPIFRPDYMRAGDATFHVGWALHSAPGNNSATMREIMTIIYFADGAHVTKPVNQNQEADRQRWLNGINPGLLANGPLNPVLG